jgi:hypothetical protein
MQYAFLFKAFTVEKFVKEVLCIDTLTLVKKSSGDVESPEADTFLWTFTAVIGSINLATFAYLLPGVVFLWWKYFHGTPAGNLFWRQVVALLHCPRFQASPP